MAETSIQQVKEGWEGRLMSIPGVMAVGIGLTKDRKPCIKVYLDRSAAQAGEIPDQIEGYVVEVAARRTFRAT
jgi:hypothetical protein